MRNRENPNPSAGGSILVFGMPRSGTTWVGKIFDSHPDTVYKHEPDSWRRLDEVPILPPVAEHERYVEAVRRYHDGIPGIRSAKVCGKTPIFAKSYMNGGTLQLLKGGIALSRGFSKLGFELPVAGAPAGVPAGGRLLWKSIESIGRLRLIASALPAAKAVHLMRHPCGYVASVLRGESTRRFEDNRGASEDYGILEVLLASELARERGLALDDFRALEPVERLAWRWALFNDEACRASADSGRCTTVRYEDVCEQPVDRTRELFAFAGLDWSEQTRAFLEDSTATEKSDYYSVYKDPRVAANKWREELDGAAIDRIRGVVSDTTPGAYYAGDW